MAIEKGDATAVQALLQSSPNLINSRTETGATPLHVAAQAGNAAIVKLLLDRGANANAETTDGITPLQVAARRNAGDVVKTLIDGTDLSYSSTFLDARYGTGDRTRQTADLALTLQILTDVVREQPDNENINFALGITANSLQDSGRAQLAFERVLQRNPGNDRARIEIARLYFAKKQYGAARKEFEEILKHNPPVSVRNNIETYLKDIELKIRRWSLSGRVDAGAFDDDNINVGPNYNIIAIAPIAFGSVTFNTLEVEESSLPVDAQGLFAAAAFSGNYDGGEEGKWSLLGATAYYQNWADDASPYESLYYESATGLRFTGSRSLFQLPLKAGHIARGGDSLLNLYGMDPSHLYVYGPLGEWRWISAATAQYRDWSELDDRDGTYFAVTETMQRYVAGGRHSFSLLISYFHDYTDAAVYENTGTDWSLGADLSLPWSSRAYAQIHHMKAKYAERETLAPADRTDTQNRFVVGLTTMFPWRLGVDVSFQKTDNNSTFALYQYDRNVATLSAFRTF